MGRKITLSVRALVIGGLCAVILAFAVVRQIGVERIYNTAIRSIGEYIGACQQAGVLPTPEQLQERLAQIEAQAKAQEPEPKK